MLDTIRTIKYSIIIVACMMLGILSSCNSNSEKTSTGDTYTDMAIRSEFCNISDRLVYDSNTLVIYYKFKTSYYGYMAPYYSESGKLCRYIDGQIVEIEQEDKNGGK